eukprot:gnl/TRDRNA2_/TRDRNA2_175979_c1_seq2.p1 gnl/TRDRNA2_/TRDRNA2_175979_c1~~gnl/TRDRNA2_/TRDRNA2_175979_c1_seq2.p1  ORF type:complete len:491 (+),score=69.23 gnl/TRDRNA2_/TRDRNA2_175979_c1_seq2:78-1550(+)
MALPCVSQCLCASAMLVAVVAAKGRGVRRGGGSSGGSPGGTSGGKAGGGVSNATARAGGAVGGRVSRSRDSFATPTAFAMFTLVRGGSRRRYGTYAGDEDLDSECTMENETVVDSSCRTLYNVTSVVDIPISSCDTSTGECCHSCIACENETCIMSIPRCDEFLSQAYASCEDIPLSKMKQLRSGRSSWKGNRDSGVDGFDILFIVVGSIGGPLCFFCTFKHCCWRRKARFLGLHCSERIYVDPALEELSDAPAVRKSLSWEARGIPRERLGSNQAAAVLGRQWERLKWMKHAELRAEYGLLGLPDWAEVPEERPELLTRLKRVTLWRMLPSEQMRHECTALGVSVDFDAFTDHELDADEAGISRRDDLVLRLVLHLWAHDRPQASEPLPAPASEKSADRTAAAAQQDDLHRTADALPVPELPSVSSAAAQHFATLRLPNGASASEVKRASHQLMRQYHPDKGPENIEEAKARVREVVEARDALLAHMAR